MKTKIYILLLYLFSIISPYNLYASAWAMVDLPIPSCLSKYKTTPPQYNFQNIYHSGSSEIILQWKVTESYKAICGFYVCGWIIEYLSVEKIFPVYSPHQNAPHGMYTIYTGQDHLPIENPFYSWAFFSGEFSQLIFSRWPYLIWFNWWAWHSSDSRNEAYLKSLQEPFKSAPMIQMYYYIGKPLLVARSNTGIVTDVFFQDRPNISNPIERAKKYLGKKWYNP